MAILTTAIMTCKFLAWAATLSGRLTVRTWAWNAWREPQSCFEHGLLEGAQVMFWAWNAWRGANHVFSMDAVCTFSYIAVAAAAAAAAIKAEPTCTRAGPAICWRCRRSWITQVTQSDGFPNWLIVASSDWQGWVGSQNNLVGSQTEWMVGGGGGGSGSGGGSTTTSCSFPFLATMATLPTKIESSSSLQIFENISFLGQFWPQISIFSGTEVEVKFGKIQCQIL